MTSSAGRTVLVTDYTWASTAIEAQVLSSIGAELLVAETGAEEELVALVAGADAILTCFAQVTRAVVRAGTGLEVIGRYGTGTDNIAVDVATELAIPVTNVPAFCVDEVAEHVLALLFALVRGVPRYDAAVRRGDWRLTNGLPTRRIAEMTLGVLGFGQIGRGLARRASALGMRILVHTRDSDRVRAAGYEAVGLEALAERSDVVSVHCPLTEATRGLVDAGFLGRMQPTAYLINAARGPIVDQEALADALERGALAGAGLDVFEPERLSEGHRLLASDRVVATPHTAFYSEESVAELARRAAENVASVLRGERPAHLVNPEVWERRRGGAPAPR